MTIDPSKVCLWVAPELKKFKLDLFNRIGSKLPLVVRGDVAAMANLPDDVIPIVGCTPLLTPLYQEWKKRNRQYVYFDRGYARRVFAAWLPKGTDGGYYRWHVNSFQLQKVRPVPPDRWNALNTEIAPWRKNGRHVVIAAPTRTYARFHQTESWIADTIDALARVTDRQLVIRDKEQKRPLQADLEGAHALVTHGSIAAVESVILGTPVFVHPDSAASLVGLTDLKQIERPVYPDRAPWCHGLAYSQFNERELVDGTLWRLLC